MGTRKRLRPEEYTVGWLCALARTEQVAAIKMLDEQHQELPKPPRDYNTYTYGSIADHNIVIACLPLSHPGTTSAARMADLLPTSFPNMRLHLFVGVGGGIPRNPPDPDASQNINLGDVVVGVDQTPGVAGVVQYDFIRDQGEAGREPLGILDKPNPELLTALGKLFSNYEMRDCNPHIHLARLTGLRSDFAHPPPGGDRLYRSTYKHVDGAPNCDQCAIDELVVRSERQPPKQESQEHIRMESETLSPVFHQGQILSGNSVIKDAKKRDELSRAYPHARCFEMEAAGVVDQTHCLVIRGIADYADSHKNQMWQPYAAGTAAAFARELLLTVQPSIVAQLETIAPTSVQRADPPFGGQQESGNLFWMVPKTSNTLFTGRTQILERLQHSLGLRAPSSKAEERQKRFVMVGDGGIGKSEVCLKFASDHRNDFWGIFWIDASSETMAKQSFIEIRILCEARTENFDQVMTWLANIRHSWLLIIDNADNPDIDYANFFPSGSRGNIILTTRNSQCRDHATVGSVDLGYLELEDATSLLCKAARIAESLRRDEQKAAAEVVQDLGFHTLAIIQAGAFIKLGFCSLEEYPILFKQQEEELLRYQSKQAQSTYGSVFATFEISATNLERSQDENAAAALSLLQILGFIHFQDIPDLMFSRARSEAIAIRELIAIEGPQNEIYQLSESQISRLPPFMMPENNTDANLFPLRWRKIINLLESYSIIKTSGIGEKSSFSMHPLAHTWTRIRHERASQMEYWKKAGSVIALSMCGGTYDVFHERLRSHVAAYLDCLVDRPLLEYMTGMTELELCQTHYKICWLVNYIRDPPKFRSLLQILEKFKTWTDASWKSSIKVRVLTAACFREDGQPKKAVELLESLAETDLPSSPFHLDAQVELAIAYRNSKQPQKAVDLLEYVEGIQKRTEGPESLNLLLSQYWLARAYIVMGSGYYGKAAELLEKVVEIDQRTLARVESKYWLARAYIGMGSGYYGKAAELPEQVIEINQRTVASDDPILLISQYWLAKAYIGMGSGYYGKAAELLEQVYEINQRTLALDDPDLLITQYWLARAYIGMGSGHYGKAAELLEQVVKIDQRTLAPDDPDRLGTQRTLEELKELIEAEKEADTTSVGGATV